MATRFLALLLIPFLVAAPAAAADRSYVAASGPSGVAALPFSSAVRVGDTVYVAGHLGLDPKTGQATTDPAVEIRLVLDAVKKSVEAAGLEMDDLVSVQVYCTDLALYGQFNDIYRGYFHEHFPARAFLGASTLLRGARFEVLGIAVKRGS